MSASRNYQQLLADLDRETGRLATLLAGTLHCQPGCSSCCIPFAVLPIEAEAMRAALLALPPAARERLRQRQGKEERKECPLLVEQRCAIYAARPVICRTQGLPLAYVDEERQAVELSACPVNFADDFTFAEEGLLFMDPFNARLFAINMEYCREQGLEPGQRLAIPELVREALFG